MICKLLPIVMLCHASVLQNGHCSICITSSAQWKNICALPCLHLKCGWSENLIWQTLICSTRRDKLYIIAAKKQLSTIYIYKWHVTVWVIPCLSVTSLYGRYHFVKTLFIHCNHSDIIQTLAWDYVWNIKQTTLAHISSLYHARCFGPTEPITFSNKAKGLQLTLWGRELRPRSSAGLK